MSKTGLKHNGSLLYIIRPFQEVLDAHQQNELYQLEYKQPNGSTQKLCRCKQ